jgi:hypothetical protein
VLAFAGLGNRNDSRLRTTPTTRIIEARVLVLAEENADIVDSDN